MALLARSRMPRRIVFTAGVALLLLLVFAVKDARAIPAFNRQTGQNCVACHAGGQFPDLTPYGPLFKLTGYTIGERAVPLAAMAVMSYNRTRNTGSPDPGFDRAAAFPKDGNVIFQTASPCSWAGASPTTSARSCSTRTTTTTPRSLGLALGGPLELR